MKIKFFLVFALMFLFIKGKTQQIVNSTNGYDVIILLEFKNIIKPVSCQHGYEYNIELTYDVEFIGNNIPNSLWTLQGFLFCDENKLSFDLPNSGGAGVVETTTMYRETSDCNTISFEELGCSNLFVVIEGLGIEEDTIELKLVNLPIELTSFTGNYVENEIHIKWVTATETNNDYFKLLKSINGVKFEEIFNQKGAGNSATLKKYSYIDREIENKFYYYKLKQVDFDGTSSESKIIAVSTDVGNCLIEVDSRFIYIKTNDYSQEYKINIFDVNGKLIFSKPYSGSYNIKLDNNLKPGLYIILVETKTHMTFYKFITY